MSLVTGSILRTFGRNRFVRALFLSIFLLAIVGAGISSTLYQRTRKEQVAPGIRYYHFGDPVRPVNFDVLRISRREKFLNFHSVLGDNILSGLEPVSNHVKAVDDPSRYPVAAVNGDFYMAGGMPLGLMVADREIVTLPALKSGGRPRAAFVIYTSGQPAISELSYRGSLITHRNTRNRISGVNRPRTGSGILLYNNRFGKATPAGTGALEVVLGSVTGLDRRERWRLTPERKYRGKVTAVRSGGGSTIPRAGAVLSATGNSISALRSLKNGSRVWFRFRRLGGKSQVRTAIGGSPVIVRRGKNLFSPGKGARHPRTVVGYNRKEIYLVVVDGRRAGWSRGMSLYELGELLLRMQCREALNLDGGGSSTMWVRGKLRNKVSDGSERSVSNALVVTSSAPRTGRLQKLVIDPSEVSILTGQKLQLYASGRDKYYNPVPMRSSTEWSTDREIGEMSQDGKFRSASKKARGRIRVRSGGLIHFVDVEVYDEPPIFQIYPNKVHLFGGEKIHFRHIAMDHKALPVVADYARLLRWSVTPALGQIDSTGLLQASNMVAKGKVSLSLGSKVRHAAVTVGTVPKLLHDFEKVSVWNFTSHPDNKLPGSFSITGNAAYRGKRGGMLNYRFDTRFDTEAAYAKSGIKLGAPMAVKVWVKGDGSSHQLRMAYRNKYDGRRTVSFNDGTLALNYWHHAVAKIPPSEEFPITFESIYVLKDQEATWRMSGSISIDDLTGLYPPQ